MKQSYIGDEPDVHETLSLSITGDLGQSDLAEDDGPVVGGKAVAASYFEKGPNEYLTTN